MGAATWQDVVVRSGFDQQDARLSIQGLLESGQILPLEGDLDRSDVSQLESNVWITSSTYWAQFSNRVVGEVESYHKANRLKIGIPKEELKSRLKLPVRLFNAALRKLIAAGELIEKGTLVHHPLHQIIFDTRQQRLVDELWVRFSADPYSPPTIKEIIALVGEDLFNALLDLGKLIQVSPEVAFRNDDFERMVEEIRKLLAKQGTISAAQVRDHFNTSRRYVLAFLEHLDSRGITIREGDVRRLKKSAADA
jgi:selenocysteine-specific elongation factor